MSGGNDIAVNPASEQARQWRRDTVEGNNRSAPALPAALASTTAPTASPAQASPAVKIGLRYSYPMAILRAFWRARQAIRLYGDDWPDDELFPITVSV